MNKEILVFDSETNGIPDWQVPSDSPEQPHIVQLAALVVDVDTRETKQSINVIIKPDGWEITPELTEIHGISHEYASDVGLPEKDVIALFMDLLGSRTRIAHNTTFDNRIIRIGLKRFFSTETADEFKAGNYFCTMINGKKIIGGKNPTLGEAYKFFTGNELVGAHNAMTDTLACLDVYWGITAHNRQLGE